MNLIEALEKIKYKGKCKRIDWDFWIINDAGTLIWCQYSKAEPIALLNYVIFSYEDITTPDWEIEIKE